MSKENLMSSEQRPERSDSTASACSPKLLGGVVFGLEEG